MNLLTLNDIEKSFEGEPVLRGVSLELRAGEIVVLLGPSGCGKTTLLRIMAGLEVADNGRLSLNDQDLSQVPVHQRGFGMVFQDYALFPHKNVFENVAFGLRMQNWEKGRIQERVQQVLQLVGMGDFAARPIYELSGGEQQRVALARSLAAAPRLILLDEPLGALDRTLRERLLLDLRRILQEAGGMIGKPEGITAVYVTHDQAEAFAIADRVMVMNEGRIEQTGAPAALYRYPRTPFVARFLGMENLLEAERLTTEPFVVQTEIGRLEIKDYPVTPSPCHPVTPSPLHPFTLLIRPEAARILDDTDPAVQNVVNGRLTDVSFRGRYQIATFAVEGITLKFELETATSTSLSAGVSLPESGETVRLQLSPDAMVLLERG